MTLDRNAVESSKLFQEFDKLASFENVTKSDIVLLKGMLLEVVDKISPHLKRIQHTFQQYTVHDAEHLLNIADHIHDFLPRRNLDAGSAIHLNAVELTYLWLAILLHDVGMFVAQKDEKQKILDSSAYRDFLQHKRERLASKQAALDKGHNVTAQVIDDALFADFIRGIHAERVHEYISTYLNGRLRFRDIDLATEVGNLCESHNWGVREPRDSRHPDKCVEKIARRGWLFKTPVNLRYLACCLRLGDILDFDRTRTPLSAFHTIHFTESISMQEWEKHLGIVGVGVSEHRAEYDGRCETPDIYVAVQHFLDWVDLELKECTRLVREFPQEDADRYKLNIAPVVERYLVQMKNPKMVAGAFRFQLEYDRIMQLLMDKSLYPDETLFLRELLQNALDACRYQRALAEDKGMKNNYIPRIRVWDCSTAPRGGADGGPRIIFSDNGVGMSMHQVENYFMRVGKSFYTSSDFEAERERLAKKKIHLEACSQFGIGFLSCFLGGDRVVVETYRYGSDPLRITINGPSKHFVIERLDRPTDEVRYNSPVDPEQDAPPQCCGTRVTVFLRDGWHKNPSDSAEDIVHQTLDAFAVNQEIPIEVIHPSVSPPRQLKANRWDCQLPRLPELERYPRLRSFMVPSLFSLADYGMRGQGAIWFLSDSGNPALRKGHLVVSGGHVRLEERLQLLWEILHYGRKEDLQNAFEELRQNPTVSPKALAGPVVSLESLRALVSWDFKWLTQVLATNVTTEYNPWCQYDDLVEILVSGDRHQLLEAWTKRSFLGQDCTLYGAYRLALFGIDVPGGFQTWAPAAGRVERHNWLPMGVSLSIDLHGKVAPKPAASRLYVPYERAGRIPAIVVKAFLIHAGEIWKARRDSKEWTKWFEGFLASWRFPAAGLYGEAEIMHLLREFCNAFPTTPTKHFYCAMARAHSKFGGVVLSRYLDGRAPFLPIDRPISQEHIQRAAEKSGVEPIKIDSVVGSLSDYLGWDITKGHPYWVKQREAEEG